MYRIIGITENGQLYLIKMKGVEEGENKKFQWNTKQLISDCLGEACEWQNSDIYKRLNGETSNGNPVFINNSKYDYMQEENPWYSKIENHNWMYGDVNEISNTVLNGETIYGTKNNGLIIYEIETGVKPTQTYDFSQSKYVKHQWNIEKSINAKIGLMYLHDYYLAYDNKRNWYDDYDTTNWLFVSVEWLISRRGSDSLGAYYAWYVSSNGGRVNRDSLGISYTLRPSFYLSTTVNIKSGTGTISDPYILEIKNN